MTGIASLVLAIGLGRLIGNHVGKRGIQSLRLRFLATGLLGFLGIVAVVSTAWPAALERALPWPPCPRPRLAKRTSC